jgi:hypothetical protein
MQSLGESAMKSSSKTKGKAWPGLGRRVEVMTLPTRPGSGEGVGMTTRMRDMSI